MSLIDLSALRALVADEVRRVLAAESAAGPAAPAPTEPSAARLWSANQVAEYLGASRSWVYDQAQAGLMPSIKVGGLLRFDPAEVRAFVRGAPAPASAVRSPKRGLAHGR